MAAAGQGRIHVLQWLLEMGVDVTAINSVRETAYDIAQRFSHLGCVKLLGRCSGEVVQCSDFIVGTLV